MSIRIKDLTKIKSLKGFTLVTGTSGLEREVRNVALGEIDENGKLSPISNTFKRASLVIAREKSPKGLGSSEWLSLVQDLKEQNILALACNSSLIKKINQDVIQYCEAERISIFSYDPDSIRIETIIYEIMQSIQGSSTSYSMEREIDKLIKGDVTRVEVEQTATSINPNFQRLCSITYIKAKEDDEDFDLGGSVGGYAQPKGEDDLTVDLFVYKDGLFVIVTMSKVDVEKRDSIVNGVLKGNAKSRDVILASSSFVYPYEELDRAFKESYYAYMAGMAEGRSKLIYDEIGTYKFLIPNMNNPEEQSFMKKYIMNMSKDQINTAIVFLRCNCNFDDAAEELICHRNTVRYRINKIREMTDPTLSEFQFYENLSAALKLYLLTSIV